MRLFYLRGTSESTIRCLARMVDDIDCEGARLLALEECMSIDQYDLVCALRSARIPDPEWSEVIRATGRTGRAGRPGGNEMTIEKDFFNHVSRARDGISRLYNARQALFILSKNTSFYVGMSEAYTLEMNAYVNTEETAERDAAPLHPFRSVFRHTVQEQSWTPTYTWDVEKDTELEPLAGTSRPLAAKICARNRRVRAERRAQMKENGRSEASVARVEARDDVCAYVDMSADDERAIMVRRANDERAATERRADDMIATARTARATDLAAARAELESLGLKTDLGELESALRDALLLGIDRRLAGEITADTKARENAAEWADRIHEGRSW